ncbi:MAG: hypothetical protein ACJASV_001103 [Pseudorhodobacter sp.]|jgi:hypothetical protein
MHTCTTNHPRGLIGKPAHNKGMFGGGHHHGWIQRLNLDARAIGCGEVALAICEAFWVFG